MVIVICGIKNIHFLEPRFFSVSCRVTSNVLGIDAAERSWVDVKTIKSGKVYAISSDVSEKRIIVYTYACIESAIIKQYRLVNTLMFIFQVILGMKRIMILIKN